jgi:hypothetical protein
MEVVSFNYVDMLYVIRGHRFRTLGRHTFMKFRDRNWSIFSHDWKTLLRLLFAFQILQTSLNLFTQEPKVDNK